MSLRSRMPSHRGSKLALSGYTRGKPFRHHRLSRVHHVFHRMKRTKHVNRARKLLVKKQQTFEG